MWKANKRNLSKVRFWQVYDHLKRVDFSICGSNFSCLCMLENFEIMIVNGVFGCLKWGYLTNIWTWIYGLKDSSRLEFVPSIANFRKLSKSLYMMKLYHASKRLVFPAIGPDKRSAPDQRLY